MEPICRELPDFLFCFLCKTFVYILVFLPGYRYNGNNYRAFCSWIRKSNWDRGITLGGVGDET